MLRMFACRADHTGGRENMGRSLSLPSMLELAESTRWQARANHFYQPQGRLGRRVAMNEYRTQFEKLNESVGNES